jgi:hypothetical protein
MWVPGGRTTSSAGKVPSSFGLWKTRTWASAGLAAEQTSSDSNMLARILVEIIILGSSNGSWAEKGDRGS